MTVRPAELIDLQTCLSLDHTFFTDHVWQMDVHEQDGGVTVNFRAARLPRAVHVAYPRDRKALLSSWHRRDCFLVATADEDTQGKPSAYVIGYLAMDAYNWHNIGWVSDLVIAPLYRRRGIATQLLHAGKEWARAEGLERLIVETSTKNHPAMCFLERLGFSFCGYHDRYYGNQDIALFFSLDLR